MNPNELPPIWTNNEIVRYQLNILSAIPQKEGWAQSRFSRASALSLAKDLILEGDKKRAAKRLLSDPAQTQALVALGWHFLGNITTGLIPKGAKPPESIFLFREFCEFILTRSESYERQAAPDSAPVETGAGPVEPQWAQ